MVICLERDADLHMAQLMPLPLTVSCFSKIQIGFTFLVPAHPGNPGQRAVKRVCVCVCVCVCGVCVCSLVQNPFLFIVRICVRMYVGLFVYSVVVFHVFFMFYAGLLIVRLGFIGDILLLYSTV